MKTFSTPDNFYSNYDLRGYVSRGANSVVRNCISKKKSSESYSSKIIDLTAAVAQGSSADKEPAKNHNNEVNMMKICSGHENICQCLFGKINFSFRMTEIKFTVWARVTYNVTCVFIR
ncbi:hypothetical protein HELRODRAFT_159558 [Helobdella robusta]|uniref:Uncharacterized protein n=1 Tax=Helobdella robusta TaxID=6412 RepID=T1EP58_HELRO|nr:hypothetical protein HELRODRAFT_159558 [Helobdella robusta]ESO12964.1 hypothetical protein HELRODRAFT_159558 [Helobdella robusta]